jgi:hypothetical protein
VIVLAHGGTAGAIAEATFLALPVLLFFLLSRWSKRRARKVEQPKGTKPPTEGRPDRGGGPS